jgi:hypothetical protein
LGFVDAPNYQGDAGGYSDNAGTLTATFAIVPEPSVLAHLLGGAAICVLLSRRIRLFRN